MRAAIGWLLPSDGIFHHSSDSLQYFLTCQGRRVALRGGDVTLPLFERYLNWVDDPAPPPSRYHGDLTSPAPSGDHGVSPNDKENTPPQDAPRKIPRKLWPRRRKERQPGSTTNQNSPSWKARIGPTANRNSASQEIGSATRPGSMANHNSAFQEAGSATRPRSMANDNSPLAGNRPGISGSMKSTRVEHPRTFLRPQHPQHPRFWTNQNSERRFDLDHPEFQGVHKPAQPSIQQDSALRSRRDSFSGSVLSSPALQRSHRDSFSGSPVGHLSGNISLTDPQREERIAGGLRPGLVLPHPRAACPDMRLDLDAAPPEAAAISRAEWPPMVVDIPETDSWRLLAAQSHPIGVDRSRPGATRANGPETARQHYTGPRRTHHTPATGVNLGCVQGICGPFPPTCTLWCSQSRILETGSAATAHTT